MYRLLIFINILLIFYLISCSEGLIQRCYSCRSRGDLGTCKDPFRWNATNIGDVHGVDTIPCSSGWCGKIIEAEGTLRNDDYDRPTERMCITKGPSDSEERCAFTVYNYKKVYICFCIGDLCNGTNSNRFNIWNITIGFLFVTISQYFSRTLFNI